jgi:hypothetical protein
MPRAASGSAASAPPRPSAPPAFQNGCELAPLLGLPFIPVIPFHTLFALHAFHPSDTSVYSIMYIMFKHMLMCFVSAESDCKIDRSAERILAGSSDCFASLAVLLA